MRKRKQTTTTTSKTVCNVREIERDIADEGDSSHKQTFNRTALSQQFTFDMFRRNPTAREPPKFVFCGVKFSSRSYRV